MLSGDFSPLIKVLASNIHPQVVVVCILRIQGIAFSGDINSSIELEIKIAA